MPYAESDAVTTLCRDYLQMKRDFIDLDYKAFLYRKVDLGDMFKRRSMRQIRYVMQLFVQLEGCSNVLYCTDPSSCPIEAVRPNKDPFSPFSRTGDVDIDAEDLRLELNNRRTRGGSLSFRSIRSSGRRSFMSMSTFNN